MLLKSRASLTCFRACFLPGRAKGLISTPVDYDLCTFAVISRRIIRKLRNDLGYFVGEIKIHVLCPVAFSQKSYRLWANGENYGRGRWATDGSRIRSIYRTNRKAWLVPVATRSKALVCGRSPAEIVGSNPTGGHGCLSVVSVICCQVEVFATSRSLVQRSPADCDA